LYIPNVNVKQHISHKSHSLCQKRNFFFTSLLFECNFDKKSLRPLCRVKLSLIIILVVHTYVYMGYIRFSTFNEFFHRNTKHYIIINIVMFLPDFLLRNQQKLFVDLEKNLKSLRFQMQIIEFARGYLCELSNKK